MGLFRRAAGEAAGLSPDWGVADVLVSRAAQFLPKEKREVDLLGQREGTLRVVYHLPALEQHRQLRVPGRRRQVDTISVQGHVRLLSQTRPRSGVGQFRRVYSGRGAKG